MLRTGRALEVVTNPLRRRVVGWTRRKHPGPRVLAISVPKAGTHLLSRCLECFPDLRCYHRGVRWLLEDRYGPAGAARQALGGMGGGSFASAHVPWSPEMEKALAEMGLRTLLIVRDPRDVLVSFVMFALARPRHPQHRLFAALPDMDARLRVAIAGSPQHGEPPRVFERFDKFLPWAEHGAHVVRFENLVGPRGGGSEVAQRAEIRGIAEHLGLELTSEQAAEVARKAFDPGSHTFRKGAVGDWRNHFTPEHEALFRERGGPLLDRLGYERGRGAAD